MRHSALLDKVKSPSSITQPDLLRDGTVMLIPLCIVMFNLMPDDPYSTWSWGKGFT